MTTSKSTAKDGDKTLVFADSNPDLLEALGELLRDKGYEVHFARDGLEALLVIRSLKPSYVILDIVMPKIDGSRVCWLIRQDPSLRDTPIIAFSSLSPQDIRRFPELSADAYVAKGPLSVVATNILLAVKYLEEKGRGDFEGGIFGYEGFRPRRVISEMLFLKRHYENLLRTFGCGVVELDRTGRILMANAEGSEILGRSELRLIGEPLPSLCPARDRRQVQDILDELDKARLPEDRRTTLAFGGQQVSMRFSSTVEEGECTGILLTLERRG
jgi:PAS domain S-box-containing protein